MINKLVDEPYWDELEEVVSSIVKDRHMKQGAQYLADVLHNLARGNDDAFNGKKSNQNEIINHLKPRLTDVKECLIDEIMSILKINHYQKDLESVERELQKQNNVHLLFCSFQDIVIDTRPKISSAQSLKIHLNIIL